MGKIITFGTLKGGVGKTMLCFNIGGILSQLGYRVLVIDSDLQGNLTNNMGIDRTQPDLLTTYAVSYTHLGHPVDAVGRERFRRAEDDGVVVRLKAARRLRLDLEKILQVHARRIEGELDPRLERHIARAVARVDPAHREVALRLEGKRLHHRLCRRVDHADRIDGVVHERHRCV